MEYVKLNNKTYMPVIGCGTHTFGKENYDYYGDINMDTTELDSAIKNGYRHFDSAVVYRNEAVLGKAWKQSGVPREEFFLVSKLPAKEPYFNDAAAVKKAVQGSLEALGTTYLDLYLIHKPWEDREAMLVAWQALEEEVDAGRLHAIGVSNFEEADLEWLLKEARIPPVVNQIESHPGTWNDALITYCQKNQVVPVAWYPLHNDQEARQKLLAIAEKYGKSWAQVIIRYQIERGVVVIPKSRKSERQLENLDVFDFALTEEDHQVLRTL